MASIFRKVANLRSDVEKSPRRFRPVSESDGLNAPGELSLGDDRDEFTAANSQAGTLTFHEDNSQDELQQTDYRRSYTVALEGGHAGSGEGITFEVTSAEKVQENKSSFVLYTILITRNLSGDRIPATISKRYSDFDKLNKQLRKVYPSLLEQVAFPKKKISGNFTRETIAQRSRAFEQFLAHTFSIPEIRESQDLADFFYQDDITSAFSCLQDQKISEAIVILEKILPVQEKVLGDAHFGVVRTVCALVVCYSLLKNNKKAQRYSEAALSCLRGGYAKSNLSVDSGISCGYGGSNSPYLLPLLQTAIRLCWETGKDKQDLEAMLTEFRRSGVDTEDCPSLEEVFQKELGLQFPNTP